MAREERLRSTAGMRGSPALALSAWRGRSGRRYVVGIHELLPSELPELGEAVVIAVRRDDKGFAHAIAVASNGDGAGHRLTERWIGSARRGGATEMHVHRLAETDDKRSAIVADLDEEA